MQAADRHRLFASTVLALRTDLLSRTRTQKPSAAAPTWVVSERLPLYLVKRYNGPDCVLGAARLHELRSWSPEDAAPQ